MKRNLALLLILTLLLSIVSFGAIDQNGVGQKLKELGVIKGDANGDLRTTDNLTREEAITTIVRLMGKEKEALATTVAPSFKDVPNGDWSAPYIAYSELKQWTNGTGDGKFGYGKNVTTQQYATFMLRVLGHTDLPYEQSMIEAAKLGLLDDVVATRGNSIITRGDVFVMMNNTLNNKPKNSEDDLIYVLGLMKKPEEEPKKPTEPETKPETKPEEKEPAESETPFVKEVIVDSLKRIKLVLSAPIDSAGDDKNYDLDSDETAVLSADSVFELSTDKKTINITLTRAAKQQEKAELTIDGLFEEDVKLKDIQFLDRTIPEVIDAKMVAKDKIKVTFSEPMVTNKDAENSMLKSDNYRVTSGKNDTLYIDELTAANKSGDAVIIQLYSDIKDDITLEVLSVDDYAGFGVINKKIEIEFDDDTTAPKVVDYKTSSLRKVTLIFDEDIVLAKDHSAFYHTNSGNVAAEATVDGKALTLTFAKGDELPAGTAYVYAKDASIKDLWGNLLDGRQVYEITVTTDKTAPKIVGNVKVKSQRKIELKFDEPVEKNDSFDITLLKDDGIVKNDFTASIDQERVSLTFDKDLYGKYKLIVEGLTDEMGNQIEKTALSLNVDDATAPEATDFKAIVYKVDADDQLLIVQFGDKMKKSDIENLENYQLDGKFLDDLDVAIKTINDGESVQIIVPEDQFDFTDNNLTDDNDLLVIGKMADAAGNKMSRFSVTLDVKNGDATGIEVKEVRLIAKDKVEFEISEKLSDVTIQQFVIFYDGERVRYSSNLVQEMKNGNTVVAFELAKDVGTDPEAKDLEYLIRSKNDLADDDLKPSQNRYGQQLVGSDGKVKDACAPEVTKVALIDEDTIYVYFSEALDEGYIAAKGTNGFSVSDGELESATLDESKKYIMVLTGKGFDKDSNVEYEDTNIFDMNGNEMKSFRYTDRLATLD